MAFKVQIINISDNIDNIILVSGLTIETVKIKYNWLLNATVKNCIVGEDDYGLVWYSGEWVCGEWVDGTWYSGIWHDGIWKNGKWYSYLIDKAMVISNRFVILDKYYTYSEFRSGIWKQGDFYDGIFGYDRDISSYNTYNDWINRTFISSYWYNGKFHSGVFKNSVWYDGIFYDGTMENSYWLYGKFYDGVFYDYEWYNGLWYGGDFVKGNWRNGSFDQTNGAIKSRFGTANLTGGTITNWWNGTFYNGEFHSGLNLDSSGKTLPSVDSCKTKWWGGNFRGGSWYGGHFLVGNHYQGDWYGGLFGNQTGMTYYSDSIWYGGDWYNGLWINGTFYDGHFYDGMWIDGLFISGYISTNTTEGDLLAESPPSPIFQPSVITLPVTNILSDRANANGRVTNNGGGIILNRGICYSEINQIPVTGNTNNNYTVTGGGGMGSISILLNRLQYGTFYYYRAFAMNITGLTYGDVSGFTSGSISIGVPSVTTYEPDLITNISVYAHGNVNASPGSYVTVYGFYYSDTDSVPIGGNAGVYTFIAPPPSNPGPEGEGAFDVTVTGLTSGITYYIRAFADNGSSPPSGLGDVKEFTTTSGTTTVPIVSSDSVTDILDTSATMNGTVLDSGGDPVTIVGVCWSTGSTIPTTGDSTSTLPSQTPFSISMTPLTVNTVYYACAYAINGIGTGYGSVITFTTSTTPTVKLISVTPL